MKIMTLDSEQIALVVNHEASRVPAKMRTLAKLAKKYKLKLRMCDGSDLDSTIRETLSNKNIKRIIIGGGDGSISLTASIIRKKRPNVEIAVLPLGTANYYARSLGIEQNLTKAFETALHGNTVERHICRANSRDFLIGVNVGTTSKMFSEVTDEEKKKYGKLAYFKGVFKVLLKTSATDVVVKANGKTSKFNSTELVVLNQNIHESVKLMPKVKGSAPYFEIITYGLGRNKLSPLFAVVIFAITFGRNQKYLTRIRTTKAKISSKSKQPVAIDGDSIGQLPLTIELHKKPVKFIRTVS